MSMRRLRPPRRSPRRSRNADVVIEAAPEKVDLKLALFREVEAAAPAARRHSRSNTSALSITELAAVLARSRPPGRHALLQSRSIR